MKLLLHESYGKRMAYLSVDSSFWIKGLYNQKEFVGEQKIRHSLPSSREEAVIESVLLSEGGFKRSSIADTRGE